MSATSPALRKLARQLLAVEPTRSSLSNGQAGQPAWAGDRLRIPLTRLAGPAGFHSLLSRALDLARRQSPSLEALIEPNGSLTGPIGVEPGAEAIGLGDVVLAELLGLLVTFIGEPLTLSLVREAWPDAPLHEAILTTEEKP
jgi:hypothetical protein